MTTVHAELIGERAVVPRAEFERLVELARQTSPVEVELVEGELPASALAHPAAEGGAFDWLAEEDDLYTEADLKVRYR